MKSKIIIAISIVLFVLSASLFVFTLIEKQNISKIENKVITITDEEKYIDLNYMLETTCDLSAVYEDHPGELKEDFCWWYQIRSESQMDQVFGRFKIPEFDYDFSNGYLVVSLGRQLSSLSYWNTEYHFDGTHPALPVFIEEPYNKNAAYIYEMDKIPFADTEICGLSFAMQNYNEAAYSEEYLNKTIRDELFPSND